MKMPGFTAEASLSSTAAIYPAAASESLADSNSVVPQSCGFFKKIRCAFGVAKCVAVCVSSPGSCISCIQGLGSCIDCLPKRLRNLVS